MTEEADRIRHVLHTQGERQRAVAVRSVCPCHGSFDLFRELRDDLAQVAVTDPSERVRREARHVLRDPLVVNLRDDELIERRELQVDLEERRVHRKQVAAERVLRRARQDSARR